MAADAGAENEPKRRNFRDDVKWALKGETGAMGGAEDPEVLPNASGCLGLMPSSFPSSLHFLLPVLSSLMLISLWLNLPALITIH